MCALFVYGLPFINLHLLQELINILVQASVASIEVVRCFFYAWVHAGCTVVGLKNTASSDSFVVASDRVNLFMSLIVCAAPLKAHATNHWDCTALDRVSHYKALHTHLWLAAANLRFPCFCAMNSGSRRRLDMSEVRILLFIMSLQLVGSHFSACNLELLLTHFFLI